MDAQDDILFRPLRINQLILKNRIVMPPIVTCLGVVTGRSQQWYKRHAEGGVGMIIVEATPVHLFWTPGFQEALATLAQIVHEAGAKILIQLFHGPRLKRGFEGTRIEFVKEFFEPEGEPIAPSATDKEREVTARELEYIIKLYRGAAKMAIEAGFDGVEPHGAHGFFLNQFFSPIKNQRNDLYGGSLENRMRFGLEVVRAIRLIVGPKTILSYRHTPVERAEGGYTLEDSKAFTLELVDAGIDVLNVSPSHDKEPADLAAALKAVVSVPVIAVGAMDTPGRAAAVLRDGKADLIAIARGLIADPDLPRKWREGRHSEVLQCKKCNELCHGNLRKRKPISCAQHTQEHV